MGLGDPARPESPAETVRSREGSVRFLATASWISACLLRSAWAATSGRRRTASSDESWAPRGGGGAPPRRRDGGEPLPPFGVGGQPREFLGSRRRPRRRRLGQDQFQEPTNRS